MKFAVPPWAGVLSVLLTGCGDAPPPPQAAAMTAPGAAARAAPRSENPLARAIDSAQWTPQPMTAGALRDVLIRVEVLLSRAHFSPGVIDGQDGENLKNAMAAYERAHGLPADGLMDAEVWRSLSADAAPVMTDYVITPADVAGPFVTAIPKDYREMAKLDRLAYTSPLEALAEKFHMDEALLAQLNPGADFGVAGTRILVTATGPQALPGPVTLVEVDKSRNQVRAYGADGGLLAAYPATVGSSEMPTPDGAWAVAAVTFDPDWRYDPEKLHFGDRAAGKLDIKPGPNNPVGAVWIALTKPTYGIHGAPEPKLVGKTSSHGCVRLTNWDARQLAAAVGRQTKVVFTGSEGAPDPA